MTTGSFFLLLEGYLCYIQPLLETMAKIKDTDYVTRYPSIV